MRGETLSLGRDASLVPIELGLWLLRSALSKPTDQSLTGGALRQLQLLLIWTADFGWWVLRDGGLRQACRSRVFLLRPRREKGGKGELATHTPTRPKSLSVSLSLCLYLSLPGFQVSRRSEDRGTGGAKMLVCPLTPQSPSQSPIQSPSQYDDEARAMIPTMRLCFFPSVELFVMGSRTGSTK